MEASEHLDRIEAKASQLVLKIQQANRMNDALLRENQQLQLELLERDKRIAGLKELLRDMEQKNTRMKADEVQRVASVQQQLEQSVRQLNACIEQLGNL
jgi:flagellar motility protein MotE (MotC chaperone)